MTQPFGDTIFVQITFTPPRLTRIQWNYQKSPLSPPSSDFRSKPHILRKQASFNYTHNDPMKKRWMHGRAIN